MISIYDIKYSHFLYLYGYKFMLYFITFPSNQKEKDVHELLDFRLMTIKYGEHVYRMITPWKSTTIVNRKLIINRKVLALTFSKKWFLCRKESMNLNKKIWNCALSVYYLMISNLMTTSFITGLGFLTIWHSRYCMIISKLLH